MFTRTGTLRALLTCTLAAAPALYAQAPANTSQSGTVKSVTATSVVISTTANPELTVTPTDTAKILQLAPGSTDLKAATPITLPDIQPGDRVLVTGHPGDTPTTLIAARVILMKSSDIASLHASQSADWQRRGTGGLVRGVSADNITVAAGAKTLNVATTPTTIYRRYAGDSVKFEDAKPGTLADIHTGDQLRVRGNKSEDGSGITAEEIVSGSFENLSGAISAVDQKLGTITLKDLTTKKTVVVTVTPNSVVKHLPEMMAAAYARSHDPAAAASAPATPPAGGGQGGPGGPGGPGGGRRGGMDLSQMVGRLPAQTLAELKPGDAVIIVASQTGSSATAITLLSGVEQLLSAPGGAATTLSPWNLGGGGGEAGGGGGQ
jgi:co-chaperonin GroES (HSP10)